jgi:deoxyribodipyrimidine photo-lyase
VNLRPTIIWFRQDLRLADNPALAAAVARGGPVVPVYIWLPAEEGDWAPGAASRWWLHQSLAALDADLRQCGSRLIVRRGASLPVLRELVRATGAGAVCWNRRYEPASLARDAQVKQALLADGLHVDSFNAALLFEPWEIQNKAGKPFQVFTPFWKTCLTKQAGPPILAPAKLPVPARWPESVALDLLPTVDWAGGLRAAWTPGERGAGKLLEKFVSDAICDYPVARDWPAQAGTSRLSPHLHFGELSPRQVWAAATTEPYRRQLIWREFAHHLLYHFPHAPERPLRPEYARFPWQADAAALRAWQRGRTGFPLVDAGMRELWATGWMHNRVRMVVASFLVKDLLIPWTAGARWFWDTLVDADLANNTFGWQWAAGCGADAAPFFRIFNPANQAEKFDRQREYIRRWVPEVDRADYPSPIVDHAAARARALGALRQLRR